MTDIAAEPGQSIVPGKWLSILNRTARHTITRRLSDRHYVALHHRREMGRWPNLDNPQTFNEKICWRRINPEPVFTALSDKVKARDYVSAVIGKEYLVPCYIVTNSVTRPIHESLPNSFVMKANHGQGYNLIVHNKGDFPGKYLSELGELWMTSNYYDCSRERHYKDIKPRLMFEQLLLDEDGKVPKDFKFYCFRPDNAPPRVIVEVIYDRATNYRIAYYTQDWEPITPVKEEISAPERIAKPANLDKAKELALKLTEGFSFARVDFYLLGDDIYFSEITFTPNGGMKPFRSHAIDLEWGALFNHRAKWRDHHQARRPLDLLAR